MATAPLPADAGGAPPGGSKDFDRPRFLRVFAGLFYVVPVRADRAGRAVLVQLSRSLQNFDGFSLRWYEHFFESESLRTSLIASIEIALITMVVATVLGTMLAYGLVRARTRWTRRRTC